MCLLVSPMLPWLTVLIELMKTKQIIVVIFVAFFALCNCNHDLCAFYFVFVVVVFLDTLADALGRVRPSISVLLFCVQLVCNVCIFKHLFVYIHTFGWIFFFAHLVLRWRTWFFCWCICWQLCCTLFFEMWILNVAREIGNVDEYNDAQKSIMEFGFVVIVFL